MNIRRSCSRFLFLLCLLLVVACSEGILRREQKFPLAAGAYWVYDVKAKWQDGGDVIREKQLQCRVEVIRTIERGPVTAYVMKGGPFCVMDSGEDNPREYIILRVGPGSYFEAKSDLLKRLEDKNDYLGGLVTSDDLILDLPLFAGKRFGDPDSMTREDGYYCWVVRKETREILRGVKGVSSVSGKTGFTLDYFTLPDETAATFVPGIGFTYYRYVHHGTVSEAEARLIEFYQDSGNN
jgi:hypothetical protein